MKANEVINKLQELIDNAKKQGHILVRIEDIEGAFPELVESEDEVIRKALLNEFIHLQSKGYKFAGLEGEEIVAWLEKQSEEARNIALRTEYEKGNADAIAEMQKPAWSDEYLFKLADKYYDKILIEDCSMDEEIARLCRLAYFDGLKKMLAAK